MQSHIIHENDSSSDYLKKIADYFYPVSIVEKEEILNKCKEIGINGICSIASDLAAITVNYVASGMGLTGNTLECTEVSTNKHAMRKCFEENGDPSPKSIYVESVDELENVELHYPIIVKPVDRSGSRGITKLMSKDGLAEAIENAKEQGFDKHALVEEFATGQEYSVEFVSWQGEHHFLAITKKYTTGAPHFIETAHIEPAPLSDEKYEEVKSVVRHALDSLQIKNGASHSELKISEDGRIAIIEIGGRMGGDCIGSDLVQLATGVDFVKAVIQVALGETPDLTKHNASKQAAIRFIFSQEDVDVLDQIKKEHPKCVVREDVQEITEGEVTDSSTRFGYYLLCSDEEGVLEQYLPGHMEE